MTTTPCTACAVQQGTHQPAEALHQIAEPDAQHLQELAAYRFTVANREARIAELESQLEAIGAGGVEPLRKGFVRLTDVLARLEQGFGANSAPVTTIKRHFEMQAAPAHPAEGVPAQKVQPFGWFITKSKLPGDTEFTQDPVRENLARSFGYQTKALYDHPTQQGLEPTMFWDADDPERCESSINNVVVEVDNCRGLRVGDIVTIQRAVRLPNLEVRITQCPDAEGNGDLEWDEVVAAQAKQGGAA